ncbi:hypothetical protein SEA_PHEDRO_26 [Microbacterium phage Phedro]|uniref:Uncharacterized protein n=1 Tax=Microbacterium phage Phedro TaxID=2725606 RepID=A0A6M3T3V8_9CAUD|nr:hypothetical protein HWD33_gp26 [Microbacterium phage Phedro]QJD52933.1 hypothetical protein SEA_PHEDRO_26 [Microbacterium phage Phedro]
MSHDSRRRKIEETLKTADNHRQLYTTADDELILTRFLPEWRDMNNPPVELLSNEDIAIIIGRTHVAVSQRRVVLKKLMSHGMTLEEIHETERWQRAERNSIQYRTSVRLLAAQCPECFCSPHAPGCSRAD